MSKQLFRTMLWAVWILVMVSMWVVNAQEVTAVHYTGSDIEYRLNNNTEHFTWVWTITITDWTDTITILDRNLWAIKAWTWCDFETNNGYCAYDDTYGYHFQRWNIYGFKPWCDLQQSNASCTDSITLAAVTWQVDANTIVYNPLNQQYYTSWVFYKWDNNWLSNDSVVDLWWWSVDDNIYSLNDTGWQVTNWSGRQWPCPKWFHVPSIWELDKLKNMMWNSVSDIHNKLLVPFAGRRRGFLAVPVHHMGSRVYLWSSSPNSASDPYSRCLNLEVDGSRNVNNDSRVWAYSIRCFYNYYQPYPQSFTLTFAVSDGNGSIVNAETGSIVSGTVIVLNTGDYIATKDGRTHLWWNIDAYATGVLESITMTWNTTVYAIFSKDLTVNYATWTWVSTIQKKSDSCSVYNTGTSCVLTTPSITENEWYENWAWKKWNDIVNPGEDITLTSDGDTYTAVATAKEFAITFVDSNQQHGNVVYSWVYESVVNTQYPTWIRDWYKISWDKPIPATMPLNWEIITASWTQDTSSGGWNWWGGGSWWWSYRKTETAPSHKSAEAQTWDKTDLSTENDDNNSSNDILEWQKYTEELQRAYEFAYKHGITTMPTIEEADIEGPLTRIAMAKMLSYYAINVLWQKTDTSKKVKFRDVSNELDAQYDNWVTLAYQLWIMWINMRKNRFRPNDLVTRWEFATALSRMLYWTADWIDDYYSTHLAKLMEEKIITNDDPMMMELRWYIMIMLMRSAENKSTEN